jgi:hypothetical protein
MKMDKTVAKAMVGKMLTLAMGFGILKQVYFYYFRRR